VEHVFFRSHTSNLRRRHGIHLQEDIRDEYRGLQIFAVSFLEGDHANHAYQVSGRDVFEAANEQCWASWNEDQATKADEATKAGREPAKELEVMITVLFDDYSSQEDVKQIEDKTMDGGEDDDIDMN
jgi:hypothetical protein